MIQPTRRALALFAVVAAIAVFATHAAALTFGLRYDDYMMLRPIGGADVHQLLTGNWGPVGDFLDAYYRPITGLYLAGLFDVFGLHAWPLHLMSLIELWLVVCLTGLFVWRDAGTLAGVLAAAAYLIHPVLPDSTSAWIGNQMHVLALIVMTSTLLVWQQRRHDPRPTTWWPIFALTAIGVLIKEDTAMALPAVLLLQWSRARIVGDVPDAPRSLWITSAAVVVALAALRLSMLPMFEVFDEAPPRTWHTIATIAVYGPLRTAVLMFQYGALVATATGFVMLLQAAGLRHAWRSPASPIGWLWIQGALLLLCFALPVAFVYDVKSTRLHLNVFAASLMLAAGALSLRALLATAPRAIAVAGTLVLLAGGAQLAHLQRAALSDRFTPCSEEDLWFDHDTRAWPVVVDDLKRWFALKEVACAEGRYRPLDQTMDLIRWRVEDRTVMLLHADATSVTLRVTRAATPPASAQVIVDGVAHDWPLRNAVDTITLPLAQSWRVSLRAAHRLDLRLPGDAQATVVTELGWQPTGPR